MSLLSLSYDGRVAVIGDIHGCSDALRQLLGQLGDLPIIVLGDVGDRGPDTRGVLDLLIEHGALGVRGNHDQWLVAWARGEGFDDFALTEIMGGKATLDSYGVTATTIAGIEAERRRVPTAHVAWLESLADAIDLKVAGQRYWIVHGGVPRLQNGVVLEPVDVVPWVAAHRPGDLRDHRQDLRRPPDLGRPMIVGHQPIAAPIVNDRLIAIDTGAGTLAGGRLAAVVVPEMRLVSVAAPGRNLGS